MFLHGQKNTPFSRGFQTVDKPRLQKGRGWEAVGFPIIVNLLENPTAKARFFMQLFVVKKPYIPLGMCGFCLLDLQKNLRFIR